VGGTHERQRDKRGVWAWTVFGCENAWWGPGAEVSVTRGVEGVATCCCDLHDLGRLSAVDVRDRLTACLERF
jgi:hypothetical protein